MIIIQVSNVSSEVDLEGSVNPFFADEPNLVAAGEELELTTLSSNNNLQPIIDKPSFDSSTGNYVAQLRVQNSGEPIGRNIAIVFDNLPEGVELLDASGVDEAGNPYLNLRNAITPGGLDRGAISDAVSVRFSNPELIRFGLNTRVLTGGANQAPTFNPISAQTVLPGSKLTIPLEATDPDGDLVTFRIANSENLPTGTLEGDGNLVITPTAEDIGSYPITIIASDGVEEVEQTFTVDVVADSVTTTRVSGVIENVSQEPLAGVIIELGDLQTVTNADGSFTLETDQAFTADTLIVRGELIPGDDVYPYIAERLPLVLEQDLQAGFNNVIDRPIYLPILDVDAGQVIDPNVENVVTTDNIPGAAVTVAANSLSDQTGEAFTGTLSITEVPADLTPAVLPEGLSPNLVVTIQPGEMVFDTPAPLSLPNQAGWAPGTEMDLWSINPQTGEFEIVGRGVVSDDGSVVETVEGGIRNSSWHVFSPIPPDILENDPNNQEEGLHNCPEQGVPLTSEVRGHSGALVETHNLVSYTSNGENRGITLSYDSLRADPREIFNFSLGSTQTVNSSLDLDVVARVSIEDDNFSFRGQEQSFAISGGEAFRGALQEDLSDLPSGFYSRGITAGLRVSQGGRTLSSPQSTSFEEFIHVNSVNSAFGSGWELAGWQQLVENFDNSVLLIDGDGGELRFEQPEEGNDPVYISPPGDFSTLEKLEDGTFRRTLKDQTVYEFNSSLQLTSVTDRNDNQTQYIFNDSQQLVAMIDPVGLETSFAYNAAGKVNKITDPTGRETLLNHDESGNLISITDPDATTRTWEYDLRHHLIAETDKRGNREEAFYNSAGRVVGGIRKDDSEITVASVQSANLDGTEGLDLDDGIFSTYVDGRGNVSITEIDSAGQEIGTFDSEGRQPVTERNDDNLITSISNARGFVENYSYDDNGNVLEVQDTLISNPEDFSRPFNALIINGASAVAAENLPFSLQTTENLESLLLNEGFNTTVVDEVPANISNFFQVWDLRFNNESPITESEEDQYLSYLESGGDLFVFGEHRSLRTRNNSVFSLVEEAGGGELNQRFDFLETQNVNPPFDEPNVIDGNQIIYSAPLSVTAGTGQLVTEAVGAENYGAIVNFEEGTLANALEGNLTTIFDINILDDERATLNNLNLLDNLIPSLIDSGAEFETISKQYTYESTFNQLTSITDELGRQTFYEIDPEDGNVLSATRVVGDVGGDDDQTISYTYTDAGLVATETDPLGRVKNYDYDTVGRVTQVTYAVGTEDEASVGYEYDLAGNQTAVIDENGNRTEFEYDELNRLTRIVEEDPDGEEELTNPISTFDYDESGNLIETVDANQNLTTNEYDELDRLIKTTDALDGEANLIYDADGNLVEYVDEEGRQTRNIYDSRDRLVETIDPEGNSTTYRYDFDDNPVLITDALGNSTRTFYDTRDRLFRSIDAEGNLTSFNYDAADNLIATVDGNGHRTEYEYDDLDRQVREIDALGGEFINEYDLVNNVIATTDEEGNTTELDYDNRDRLVGGTNAEGGSITSEYDDANNLIASTDEENRVTNYQYDALNRQIASIDPLGNVSSYDYDSYGNQIRVTDANLNTTNYSYDPLHRVDLVTNALGDTSATEYDAVGNVLGITDELGRITAIEYEGRDLATTITDAEGNVTTTAYDEVGNEIAITDPRGNTTSYEYDNIYRLTKEIDANDGESIYSYDAVDNLLGYTDELNRTTIYSYDDLNRPITVTDPLLNTTISAFDGVGQLISVTDASNRTTNFTYDGIYRQTSITNPLGDTITTEYDAVGNVLAVTDELNRTSRFTYEERNLQTSVTDPLNHTSTTEYDAVGLVLSTTDPIDNQTTYGYDALYRLTSETDEENRTTTYGYDPVGNILSLTDPEQNTTSYTYDNIDRLITDTNQLGDTRTYAYDEASNQVSSIDRNGREINYTFDRLNRNTAEVWLDEAGNPLRAFNFEYDAASQLTSAVDPDSTYSYEYDLDGRITSVDNGGTIGVPNVVFNYNYDPVDNLTQVNDSIDGVEAGVETFAYDDLDRVTSITQFGAGVTDKRVDIGYDAASQMTDLTRYSDLAGTESIAATNYTFDNAGRLTNLTHDQEGNVLSAYEWVYDNANRITQATSPDGVADFNYDGSDQLLDANYDFQSDENYVYDENGNRVNDGYVTGDNNRLQSDGTYNYEYDGEGNRVSRTEIATGEVTEYEWDYRNRLVAVATRDSEDNVIANSEYAYDIYDRRIAKSVDADGDGAGEAVVERYVHDGEHIALTFDGEGNQTERFLHGLQIDQVLAQENAGGEVLWALGDNQGSVRMLLDNGGNVVNNITYDAFGNITVESNPEVNFRFGYTGREFDEETGQYYYRTRYYDPAVGQFINEDTIGFDGGDANLYRYVANSPINYNDPTGEFIPPPVAFFAVGFAIDTGIQVFQNGGFENYDWKQSAAAGLSSAIAGPLAGKFLGAGASLATTVATNAAVGGLVDGGLKLGRNALDGNKLFDGVLQEAAFGALFSGLGEAAEPLLKRGFKNLGSLFAGGASNTGKSAAKSALNNADNLAKQVGGALDNADGVAKGSKEAADAVAEAGGNGGKSGGNGGRSGGNNGNSGGNGGRSGGNNGTPQAPPPKFEVNTEPDGNLTKLNNIRDTLKNASRDLETGFGDNGLTSNFRKGFSKGKHADIGVTKRTVAFGDANIDGRQFSVGGFSGEQNFSAFAPLTKEGDINKLPSFPVGGTPRNADAEIKILEQILRDTSESSVGAVNLVVDRISCASCANSAIQEFSRRRPGVGLKIIQKSNVGG